MTATSTTTTQRLAAAITAIVLFDAVVVGAPFLAVIAIPFALAAWRYRGERRSTTVALVLWCALYVAIGVSYGLANGLHAPAEPGQARETINPGDFAFAYLGTPAAAWLGVRLVASTLRRRSRLSHAPA